MRIPSISIHLRQLHKGFQETKINNIAENDDPKKKIITTVFHLPTAESMHVTGVHFKANHELIDVLVDGIPAKRFKHFSLYLPPNR